MAWIFKLKGINLAVDYQLHARSEFGRALGASA
jgi:hypothetical protein